MSENTQRIADLDRRVGDLEQRLSALERNLGTPADYEQFRDELARLIARVEDDGK